jgi:uncharacterized protein YraI
MPTIPGRAGRWLVLALAGWLCLPLLVTTALAQESPALAPGAPAVVGNADGDPVLLRDGPGYDAAVLSSFPEGTTVGVGDGPIAAADGSRWYGVTVDGQAGYMDATYLVPAAAPVPEPPAAEATEPPTEPAEPAASDATAPTASEPEAAANAEDRPAETAVTTDAVNLRAEPRADAPVRAVVPAGSVVTRSGDVVDGFAPILYDGGGGWAAIAFLELGAGAPATTAQPAAPEPTVEPTVEPTAEPTPQPTTASSPAALGEASATDLLNLRAGPSYADEVLRVLPPGAPVEVTGAANAGFLPVLYNGTSGWIDAAYLEIGAAATPAPASPPAAETADAAGSATTTETVNLRAGPSEGEPIEVVLPAGATVETTGVPENGFYPVAFADQTGWVADAFLRFEGGTPSADATRDATPEASPTATPEATPVAAGEEDAEAAAADALGFTGIAWPVAGGTWSIMQGYNGSSHQNQDGLWQYYYSLDLVREEGETAGQTVVSPVNGTVRWTDPSTGGMSIDIGGGHAVAIFHVAVDPSLEAGDPLTQGQPVGTISGPGGPGFAGTPHLHFTLWETEDGGNWSRAAAPFVGPYAIAGQAFPDTGGSNQHRGTTFTP